MTNDDDRRAAKSILWVATLIDDEDAIIAAFTAHRIAAERRGIERAAGVADEHACQHCAHKIRLFASSSVSASPPIMTPLCQSDRHGAPSQVASPSGIAG